jgi:DtxR family transcriptional regulator, Mn-dependent transcriptional regulator
MITISKEDYLKAIATAGAEDEDVIPTTLARCLCVTRPSVTAALKRLTKDGLVRVGKDGRVRLTPTGREIAYRTIVRHHLIERMLTELFDMPWHAVHDEAERLEHVVSPAFERKLIAKLGKNSVCPHGNLPMQTSADLRKKGFRPLYEAAANERYRIACVYERDRQLLEMLDREGVRPGALIGLQAKNYDGTTTLGIGKGSLRLGEPAAKKIWVKKA